MGALQPIAPSGYASLGALLADAMVQFKTATALVECDRKRETRRLTYVEVARLARARAAQLEAWGVGAGDRVAILMQNQPTWLISAMAAFWRGAVLIPLDYKLTPAEQKALLAHAKPKVLVTEAQIARRLGALDVPHVLTAEAPDDDAVNAQFGDAPLTVVPRERADDACIVYSSGTGGRPKGCVLTHGNYLAQLESLIALFPITTGDRYFSILPTNHAIDFMCGFIGPFIGGATVVHQRTLRPEFIVDTMKSQQVTHMAIVPLLLEAFERNLDTKLAEAPPWKQRVLQGLQMVNGFLTEKRANHRLSSKLVKPVHDAFGGHLRFLFCGGAFVDRARAERFYELGLPVLIGYGLTECCTVATVNTGKPFRADSVGPSVQGVEVRVADPDASGIGEVHIRGATVMSRYLDDPELTAETIVDGWLLTGDRGWLDAAGHLHLVGRARNMIVTAGGKNIYPEDIEHAFEGVDVEELVVFAENYVWPKDALGAERLFAVVRPKDGDDVGRPGGVVAELAARNRRLPDFKRISGVLTWDEAFPRTASMKIKRQDLAAALRKDANHADLHLLPVASNGRSGLGDRSGAPEGAAGARRALHGGRRGSTDTTPKPQGAA